MTRSIRLLKSVSIKVSCICILSMIMWSCGTTSTLPNAPIKNVVEEDLIHFNILAVNDVYEIVALENGTIGGMARVATLRDSLKKENPNTFLTMAGIIQSSNSPVFTFSISANNNARTSSKLCPSLGSPDKLNVE